MSRGRAKPAVAKSTTDAERITRVETKLDEVVMPAVQDLTDKVDAVLQYTASSKVQGETLVKAIDKLTATLENVAGQVTTLERARADEALVQDTSTKTKAKLFGTGKAAFLAAVAVISFLASNVGALIEWIGK